MELLHSITHPSRIQDVKFCQRVVGEGELLLIGAEDKKLSIYDVPKDRTKPPTIIAEMVGHSNRSAPFAPRLHLTQLTTDLPAIG